MGRGAVGRLVGLLCLVVVGVGCGGGDAAQRSPCQDVRLRGGDGGLSVAFGWDDAVHAFSRPAPLLVCIGATDRRVTLTGTPGITVTPASQDVVDGTTPVRFEVAVSPGVTGKVTYAQFSLTSGQSVHEGLSVTVTSTAQGWSFGTA